MGMMKIYKVRHKATGFFYNGRGDWDCLVPNPDGKWYKTKHTYITYLETYGQQHTITISKDGRLYKKNREVFDRCLTEEVCKLNDWNDLVFKVNADDFELVEYDVLLANPRVVK